jgi:hypothetical protein
MFRSRKARSGGIAPSTTKREEHPKLLLSPDNGGFLPPLSFSGIPASHRT